MMLLVVTVLSVICIVTEWYWRSRIDMVGYSAVEIQIHNIVWICINIVIPIIVVVAAFLQKTNLGLYLLIVRCVLCSIMRVMNSLSDASMGRREALLIIMEVLAAIIILVYIVGRASQMLAVILTAAMQVAIFILDGNVGNIVYACTNILGTDSAAVVTAVMNIAYVIASPLLYISALGAFRMEQKKLR